jgi:positive regulator of sigma E activity
MKKQLVVIAKDGETITLENTDAGCNSCSTKGVCGVGVLGRLGKKTIVQHHNDEQIGDIVEVNIDNTEFIKHSAVLYLAPIGALFLGALVAHHYYPNNTLYQAIIAIIFLFISLLLLKIMNK